MLSAQVLGTVTQVINQINQDPSCQLWFEGRRASSVFCLPAAREGGLILDRHHFIMTMRERGAIHILLRNHRGARGSANDDG